MLINYFTTGIVSACFTVTAIVIGVVSKNLSILALGLVIAFILNFIQCFYVLITQIFEKKFSSFLLELKNILIIGALMISGYILINKVIINNVLLSAIFKFLVGTITYSIGLYVTKEYKLLKKITLRK